MKPLPMRSSVAPVASVALAPALGLLAFALASAGGPVLAAAPVPTITLRAEVTAVGAQITLADLGQLRGVTAAEAQRLLARTIAPAPRPGQTLYINRARVLAALPAGWATEGSAVVKVGRAVQTVEPQVLCDAALAAATQALGPVRPGIEQALECNGPREALAVPAGKLQIRADASALQGVDGPQRVSVEMVVDGKTERTLGVGLRLTLMASQWCALGALAEGSTVAVHSFAACRRPVRHTAQLALSGAALPLGRLRRALRAHEPVLAADVAPPEAALAGDSVTVRYRAGAFDLESQGLLTQDARVGDAVRVQVGHARQPVRGRLTGERFVELESHP